MNFWLVSSRVIDVVLDQLDVRQEQLARHVLERLVHRHVDLRVDHHLAEVLDQLAGDAAGDLDAAEHRAGDRDRRVDRRSTPRR